jgi:rare lipoprotein A
MKDVLKYLGIYFLIFFVFLFFYTLYSYHTYNNSLKEYRQKYIEEIITEETVDNSITGIGSYYDYDLQRSDQKCRSNSCYSMSNLTCASRDFDRGTMLKVTNLDNGKEVVCRVNDYGPELSTGRILDLSSYSFSQISELKLGLVNIKIDPLY